MLNLNWNKICYNIAFVGIKQSYIPYEIIETVRFESVYFSLNTSFTPLRVSLSRSQYTQQNTLRFQIDFVQYFYLNFNSNIRRVGVAMGACINGKLQLIRETSRSAAAAATAAADCAADAARAVLLQVFNQFLMKSKIAIDLFS